MIYKAHAEWDPEGAWVVTVPDVPGAITQCSRLDQAADDIAEALTLITETEVTADDVTVEWDVAGEGAAEAHEAAQLREQADRLAEEAAKKTEAAVIKLRRRNFTYRDIGAMTGVAHQRVHQIAAKKSAGRMTAAAKVVRMSASRSRKKG